MKKWKRQWQTRGNKITAGLLLSTRRREANIVSQTGGGFAIGPELANLSRAISGWGLARIGNLLSQTALGAMSLARFLVLPAPHT